MVAGYVVTRAVSIVIANHLMSQYANPMVTSLPRLIPERLAYRNECSRFTAKYSLECA